MSVSGLRFCARAFSSRGERGHSSLRCAGLSPSWPLLLRGTASRRAGSVVVAHGPSCSAAYGILPDQGANPRPLHWQADSQPLCHQGSPQLQPFKQRFQDLVFQPVLRSLFLLFLLSRTFHGLANSRKKVFSHSTYSLYLKFSKTVTSCQNYSGIP